MMRAVIMRAHAHFALARAECNHSRRRPLPMRPQPSHLRAHFMASVSNQVLGFTYFKAVVNTLL